jgi:hypothetical protein
MSKYSQIMIMVFFLYIYIDQNRLILCFSDKFLMADEPLPEDKTKRVIVRLKRENDSDMQLWKIEPVSKKMKN